MDLTSENGRELCKVRGEMSQVFSRVPPSCSRGSVADAIPLRANDPNFFFKLVRFFAVAISQRLWTRSPPQRHLFVMFSIEIQVPSRKF